MSDIYDTGPRPSRSNFLLLILTVGMDVCWIYVASKVAYLALFAPLPEIRPGPEPLALAALEGAAVLLSALFLRWERISVEVARLFMGVAGLAAVGTYIWLVHPPLAGRPVIEWLLTILFTTVISIIVWSLGVTRYSERVSFNDVYRGFRSGLIAIGLAVLLGSVLGSRGANMLVEIGPIPVWFFVCALAALGVANRDLVREEAGEGATGGGNSIWNLTIGVSMSLILLAALATGGVSGDSFTQGARALFVGLILLIIFPFYLIVYALFALLAFIFQGVNFGGVAGVPVGERRSTFEDAMRQMERAREDFINPRPRPEGGGLPFDIVTVGTWVIAIVIVLAVVWAASQGLRRLLPQKAGGSTLDRESIGSWALLWQQIRAGLAALLARLRRRKGEEVGEADDLAALRGKAEWSGTLSVREIYALLQKSAAALGHPRAPHQTPIEYLSVLSGVMPNLRSELSAITSAYLHARYGALPASGPMVRAATQAWERAEGALREAQARE